jgi:hypothetical protein
VCYSYYYRSYSYCYFANYFEYGIANGIVRKLNPIADAVKFFALNKQVKGVIVNVIIEFVIIVVVVVVISYFFISHLYFILLLVLMYINLLD